jgi:hypothetical protein
VLLAQYALCSNKGTLVDAGLVHLLKAESVGYSLFISSSRGPILIVRYSGLGFPAAILVTNGLRGFTPSPLEGKHLRLRYYTLLLT